MSVSVILSFLLSQPGYSGTTATLTLPKMERTAQSFTVGDGGASLRGLNALGVNPAGLYTNQMEIISQYHQALSDTNLVLLGMAYPWRRWDTTLALSYLGFQSSNFDKRDQWGQSQGQYDHQDQMVSLSVSHPFYLFQGVLNGSPSVGEHNPVYLGLSLKYFQFEIDSFQAKSFALDVGGRYDFQRVPFSFGMAILSLGRGPVFIQQESKLPTRYVLSAAYRVVNPVTVTASVNRYRFEGKTEMSLGTEFRAGKSLALRGSYTLHPGGPSLKSGLQNLTMGIGLKLFADTTLDYAFQSFDSSLQEAGLIGTHRMTMTFRFGQSSSQKNKGL